MEFTSWTIVVVGIVEETEVVVKMLDAGGRPPVKEDGGTTLMPVCGVLNTYAVEGPESVTTALNRYVPCVEVEKVNSAVPSIAIPVTVFATIPLA